MKTALSLTIDNSVYGDKECEQDIDIFLRNAEIQ